MPDSYEQLAKQEELSLERELSLPHYKQFKADEHFIQFSIKALQSLQVRDIIS